MVKASVEVELRGRITEMTAAKASKEKTPPSVTR